MGRHVHLVEPIGRGGIAQHAAALADDLRAAGIGVTLHTAVDAEASGAHVCGCIRWFRRVPAPLRQLLVAAAYVVWTLPHLARHVLELLRCEDREAPAPTLGDEAAVGELVPEPGREA